MFACTHYHIFCSKSREKSEVRFTTEAHHGGSVEADTEGTEKALRCPRGELCVLTTFAKLDSFVQKSVACKRLRCF